MSKKTDAWMPLYIGDYLADTARLTTEGHGAYLLILMDYWRNGPPPDDDGALSAITKLPLPRWRKVRPQLQSFFQIDGGFWHQKRADEERIAADDITAKRRDAAYKRWCKDHANGDANASANDIQSASPLPSPLPPSEDKSSSGLEHAPPALAPAAEDSGSPKARAKRRTIIDPNWYPDPEPWKWAIGELNGSKIDLDREIEKFRDHWMAKAELRADWDATFRNWIRRAHEYANQRSH